MATSSDGVDRQRPGPKVKVTDDAIRAAHEAYPTHLEAAQAVGLSRRRYTARATALGLRGRRTGRRPKVTDSQVREAVSTHQSLAAAASTLGIHKETMRQRMGRLGLSYRRPKKVRVTMPVRSARSIIAELEQITDHDQRRERMITMLREHLGRSGHSPPARPEAGSGSDEETP